MVITDTKSGRYLFFSLWDHNFACFLNKNIHWRTLFSWKKNKNSHHFHLSLLLLPLEEKKNTFGKTSSVISHLSWRKNVYDSKDKHEKKVWNWKRFRIEFYTVISLKEIAITTTCHSIGFFVYFFFASLSFCFRLHLMGFFPSVFR